MHRHVTDHVTYAAGHQHLLEATARANDEHDRSRRRQTRVEQFEHALGIDPLPRTKGVERQQQRQQQRADRVADHVHPAAEEIARGQCHIGKCLQQHQEHRQQHRGQSDAKTRQAAGLRLAGQLVDEFLRRVARDVFGDERAVNRTGNDRCRQRHDQTVQDGFTDIRPEHANRQQRARVRRNQTVHRRQTGQQRNTNLDQ